ncbi:globin [Phenylobacterium sp.]|uniref:globin n=1 Tax=Phenylobacterium sp. TaxID=1871053 RepID=UPI003568806E
MNSAELVAGSLETLAERVGDPAPQVYARLFAEYPKIEALFVRDTTGAVRGEMLAVAFECILDIGGAGAYAANLIAAERVNHEGVGVPPEVFGRFFPMLAETCQALIGEAWTPEVDAAWRELLARLDFIISRT